MKNKLFILFIAFVMACTNLRAQTASGICGPNLTWSLNDSVLTISGSGPMYDWPDDVTPWSYNLYYITNIIIGDSVTSISDGAFASNSYLHSVAISKSVTYIGSTAFEACGNITSISIDSGNPVYDSRNNCNAIIEIATNKLIKGCKNTVIPNSVTIIGANAFGFCHKLTSIIIPDGVTSIEEGAFDCCSDLTSITLPNSLTYIGNAAFNYCVSLTSVIIPDSVTSLEASVFSHCTGLTSITLPNNLTTINEYAFRGCSHLTSITIPNGVTDIRPGVFWECTNLTSVTCLSNRIKYIGGCTFSDCEKLSSITIPDSVTFIDSDAFRRCSSLTSITIPNRVSCIGDNAFRDCGRLTSVTIGNNTNAFNDTSASNCGIGEYAFCNCRNLMSVTCYATTPPFLAETAFASVNCSAIPLSVPIGCVTAYKTTPKWKEFNPIKVIGSEKPIYLISFVNVINDWAWPDILQRMEVEEGRYPIYSGPTPTKPSDGEYIYTFKGWTPEISPATADATYTATYNQIAIDAIEDVCGDDTMQTKRVLIDGKMYILLPDGTRFDSTGKRVE